MKRCKRLLLLPCCFCFLTMKICTRAIWIFVVPIWSPFYLLGDMLLSRFQYTRIYFAKGRSSNSLQAWPWLDLFQFSLATTSQRSIHMHQAGSIITRPSTSGFFPKLMNWHFIRYFSNVTGSQAEKTDTITNGTSIPRSVSQLVTCDSPSSIAW